MKLKLFAPCTLLLKTFLPTVECHERGCADYDEERADTFFLMNCQVPLLRERRRAQESGVSMSSEDLQDLSSTTIANRGLQGTGDPLQDFETEFHLEFFDVGDDLDAFSSEENDLINLVLGSAYNEVFGCCREIFINEIVLLESRIIDFDQHDGVTTPSVSPVPPVYRRERKRKLQRVSSHRSLVNSYRASGKCRACTIELSLFNDLRIRRELTSDSSAGACNTDDFNILVQDGLRVADISGFENVRSSNDFPFFDCNGNGIYEVDGVVDETTCAPSVAPVRVSQDSGIKIGRTKKGRTKKGSKKFAWKVKKKIARKQWWN